MAKVSFSTNTHTALIEISGKSFQEGDEFFLK